MKHISLQPQSAETCRKLYVREHAKFIHSSYTIAEDLGKKVTINASRGYGQPKTDHI